MFSSFSNDQCFTIYINEHEIRSADTSLTKGGLNINTAHRSEIPEGLMEGFSIKKMNLFIEELSHHTKGISSKKVHLILPHQIFEYKHVSLLKSASFQEDIHDMKSHISKEKKEHLDAELVYQYKAATTKSYTKTLAFLNKEIFESLQHAFSKNKMKIASIKPDIFTVISLYDDHDDFVWMHVGQEKSYIVECNFGVLKQHRALDFSYSSLGNVLRKTEISDSQEYLMNTGFLSYRDKNISQLLFKELHPHFKFFRKEKQSDKPCLLISFDEYYIPGLVDIFQNKIFGYSKVFDIYDKSDGFDEVLTIPRHDLFGFQFLLAEALGLLSRD